jgi:hypothetical protein
MTTQQREITKIQAQITMKKLSGALKIIHAALRENADNPYAQYRLRHVRAGLLKNNGVKVRVGYAHMNKDIDTTRSFSPFVIRHIKSSGAAGNAPFVAEDTIRVGAKKSRKVRVRKVAA